MQRLSSFTRCPSRSLFSACVSSPYGSRRFQSNINRKMLPKDIVKELDRYVIGQDNAKKAVANALHSRWRREQLNETLRKEISPKNILMVGPSGVGKTEIARRLAKLCNAPFIKVEATKYTETGFQGGDVDSIIKNLVNIGIELKKKQILEEKMEEVQQSVEDKVLKELFGVADIPSRWKEKLRHMLRKGDFNEYSIPVYVGESSPSSGEPDEQIQTFFNNFKLPFVPFYKAEPSADAEEEDPAEYKTIPEAMEELKNAEIEQLNEKHEEEIVSEALKDVQERGIVFIDEIDKVCVKKEVSRSHGDASDEGVQRDLLPIIEGTVINTKHGDVDTSKILFIASGAFYSAKPRDILPELQGRLPIRVHLSPLTEDDMLRILVEPKFNLVKQQVELMKTEGIDLELPDESNKEIARLATEMNRSVENIGARRLHSIVEKVMEETSFSCPIGEKIVISVDHIRKSTESMLQKVDTSRYII